MIFHERRFSRNIISFFIFKLRKMSTNLLSTAVNKQTMHFTRRSHRKSEYDQEILRSHSIDQPTAP